MRYVVVIIGFILFSFNSQAQQTLQLSESGLKSMIDSDPPSVKQIKASFLATQTQHMDKNDRFGFRLEGDANYGESDERTLGNFDGGVTQAQSSYSLGVVKPTRYGLEVGLKSFRGKTRNLFVSDAATSGMSVNLAVDLFENFLGRKSNSDFRRSEWSVKRAALEKDINLKVFESNVRKLYWSLVANNEKKKLLESLVKSSERQYNEALRRQKEGVADTGEVARYRSEWTSRKANLLTIQYQDRDIIRSMKELIPELQSKQINLAPYNIEKIRGRVLACTAAIGSIPQAPMQYTNYDEIAQIFTKEEEFERRVANTYGDPKVKLVGEYASVGRDFGYTAAQENFQTDPRARQSVGLQVSIPLGSRTSDNSEIKEMLAKQRNQALAEQNLLKVKAYHDETRQIVKLLREVVANQKDTNTSLEKSLKLSRLKYKQARISLQELISEQDTYLRSRLDEIDTNLAVITSLIDYFSVFNTIPCEFNRI